MPDYQKMYSLLFNRITDVIGTLQEAQNETEELYLSAEDTPMHILDTDPEKK